MIMLSIYIYYLFIIRLVLIHYIQRYFLRITIKKYLKSNPPNFECPICHTPFPLVKPLIKHIKACNSQLK